MHILIQKFVFVNHLPYIVQHGTAFQIAEYLLAKLIQVAQLAALALFSVIIETRSNVHLATFHTLHGWFW